MNKEIWIYNKNKNTFIKATKWNLFWKNLKFKFIKWKLIDTSKYCSIPWEDIKKQFVLSDKEYKDSKKIYEEKGTISYEFIPSGIGCEIKVHVLKTGEIINITDFNNW